MTCFYCTACIDSFHFASYSPVRGKERDRGNEVLSNCLIIGAKMLIIKIFWSYIICLFSKMEPPSQYQCLFCPRSFRKYLQLHKHVTYSHDIRRGTAWCGVCNETFSSMSHLMVHTLCHCEGRPQCPRYFHSIHMRAFSRTKYNYEF